MQSAVIYARISQDREGREVGVENQTAACRALAAKRGWQVIGEFADNDASASTRSKKKRPQYEEMLGAVERGAASVVIAYSNSRLTRRPREFEDLIALHERTGVRFATVTSGDDDLSTVDGRQTARIRASIDAAEAERLGERVAFAHEAMRRRGQDTGGPIPFGFENDRVTPKPDEAATIREAARAIIEDGATWYSIAKRWTAHNVGGKRWSPTSVRSALTRPRNVGRIVVNGVDYPRVDGPTVLTDEQLEALLAIVASHPRPARGRKPTTSTAVAVVRCGVCGARVELAMSEGRRIVRCAQRGGGVRHVSAQEARLDTQLAQVALSRILSSPAAPDRPDVVALRKKRADLEAQRSRARADVDGYEDEDDRAYARDKVTEISAEVRAAQLALDEALAGNVAARASHLVTEATRDLGLGVSLISPQSIWPRWQELWSSWPISDRRELLRAGVIELMPAIGHGPKHAADWRLRVDGNSTPSAATYTGEPF